MAHYPPSIQRLIDVFSRLPGVGPKTAARFVFFLIRSKRDLIAEFTSALSNLEEHVVRCHQCLNFSETTPCSICGDKHRDQNTVCIVATPQDLEAVERSGVFSGVYHVLGGVLAPTEGVTPDKLTTPQLERRITENGISEIIIALNADLDGETTTLYLKNVLGKHAVRLTRLARGIPTGSDIEYADELTLKSALEGRNEV